MAYAYVSYPTDGINNLFSVPFGYISKTHILVYLNGVPVGFNWVTNSSIALNAVPSAGLVVTISRTTPIGSRLVDFIDGTILTEHELDKDANQAFYLLQEMRDDIEQLEAGMLGSTTIDEITNNAINGAITNVLSSETITTLQDDVAAALATSGGATVYYQPTEPTSAVEGDLWLDTADGNTMYLYTSGAWALAQDQAIQDALTEAGNAVAIADGKIVTFAQPTSPTADGVGDIWIDTGNFNKLRRWDGSAWVDVTAESIKITMSTTAPVNPQVNDIWYDTDDFNKSYQWNGTSWAPLVTSIHGSLVVDGTIVGSKILAGEIGASHLSVTQLDAISANMGTITTGALTLTSIGPYRLEISSHATYPLWYGTGAMNDANGRFYIKADGTAVFKGALSAATGTFAGSLSAATGTFAGSLSAATGSFAGVLTASAVNAVNTINIAGNAITVPGSQSPPNASATISGLTYSWAVNGTVALQLGVYPNNVQRIFTTYTASYGAVADYRPGGSSSIDAYVRLRDASSGVVLKQWYIGRAQSPYLDYEGEAVGVSHLTLSHSFVPASDGLRTYVWEVGGVGIFASSAGTVTGASATCFFIGTKGR